MDGWMWIVIIVAVLLVLGIVAWVALRGRGDKKLKERYGTEYDRTVREKGSEDAALAELRQREERHRDMNLSRLPAERRDAVLERWRGIQKRFVDEPARGVLEADTLMTEVMGEMGYPTGDFAQQAADLSVEHAHAVNDYRRAHAIAEDARSGSAGTEELREAILGFRSVLEGLVGREAVRDRDHASSGSTATDANKASDPTATRASDE